MLYSLIVSDPFLVSSLMLFHFVGKSLNRFNLGVVSSLSRLQLYFIVTHGRPSGYLIDTVERTFSRAVLRRGGSNSKHGAWVGRGLDVMDARHLGFFEVTHRRPTLWWLVDWIELIRHGYLLCDILRLLSILLPHSYQVINSCIQSCCEFELIRDSTSDVCNQLLLATPSTLFAQLRLYWLGAQSLRDCTVVVLVAPFLLAVQL